MTCSSFGELVHEITIFSPAKLLRNSEQRKVTYKVEAGLPLSTLDLFLIILGYERIAHIPTATSLVEKNKIQLKFVLIVTHVKDDASGYCTEGSHRSLAKITD